MYTELREIKIKYGYLYQTYSSNVFDCKTET